MKVMIYKTRADYEYNGKLRTGKCWKVEELRNDKSEYAFTEQTIMFFPSSRTKANVFDAVRGNLGQDVEIIYLGQGEAASTNASIVRAGI